MPRLLEIGAVFAVLGAVALGMPPVESAFSGRTEVAAGTIVYSVQFPVGGLDSDLCAMRADGSQARRLTRGWGYDTDPAVSPNGRLIAFEHRPRAGESYEGQIHLVRANGLVRRDLTREHDEQSFFGNDHEPAWSPDGSRLAFSLWYAISHAQGSVYLMNRDGSGRLDLGYGISPVWSPDGKRIAFENGSWFERRSIHVMNADGSARIVLTPSGSDPTWSPDGRTIAFVDHASPGYARSEELYVVNSDGSGLRRLTSNDVEDHEPTWSPDGKRIAFVRGPYGAGDIYVMNADGSAIRNLTRSRLAESSPAWHSGGSAIGLAPRQSCAPSVVGTRGSERLRGTQGDDALFGLGGNDVLAGAAGRDYLDGGPGSDRLEVRDGRRDQVMCGTGRDRVLADRRDLVGSDCERVGRR